MRKCYCIEFMLPSRPENAVTVDVWVWADDECQARCKVEARLQKLIGDDRIQDPGAAADAAERATNFV